MENLNRASWLIKHEHILSELIKLMDLDQAEIAALVALRPAAQDHTKALTTIFYSRLYAHAETAEYLQGIDQRRLDGMLVEWFLALFSGSYDEAYARHRLGIGAIHVRIGLPVRYPLAMLDVVMQIADELIADSADPSLSARAFRKVLALDVALFNQAYEDHQLRHLAELVGGERLARMLLSGQ